MQSLCFVRPQFDHHNSAQSIIFYWFFTWIYLVPKTLSRNDQQVTWHQIWGKILDSRLEQCFCKASRLRISTPIPTNDFWLVVSNIYLFHHIWDNPSHWLIFFKIVKTTNQVPRFMMLGWPWSTNPVQPAGANEPFISSAHHSKVDPKTEAVAAIGHSLDVTETKLSKVWAN